MRLLPLVLVALAASRAGAAEKVRAGEEGIQAGRKGGGAVYLTTSNCDGRGDCPADRDKILRLLPSR